MPPSLAAANASREMRAWLCAVTIRSEPGAISEATTSLGLACNLTSIPAEHVKGRHAEMAGTDEGDPHGGLSVLSEASRPSIPRRRHLSPRPHRSQRVINRPGLSASNHAPMRPGL